MQRTMGSRFRWLYSGLAGLLVAVTALAWSASAAAQSATVEQKASTTSFNLTLDIGPAEQMLTADQAKAQGAKTGEVMAAMPGMAQPMAMAMGNRHVEVHVARKSTGAVVQDATVTISLTNTATNASTKVDPALPMYGIAEGLSDWHYGNNADLPAGTYRVVVGVNGESATFNGVVLAAAVTTATSSMAMSSTSSMAATSSMAMPARAPSTGGGGLTIRYWLAGLIVVVLLAASTALLSLRNPDSGRKVGGSR